MRKIVKGGLYRHFKGMYYYVLDMFLSDVDQEKYPDVEQKERFKLMSGRD